jgi:hypothetical protein
MLILVKTVQAIVTTVHRLTPAITVSLISSLSSNQIITLIVQSLVPLAITKM